MDKWLTGRNTLICVGLLTLWRLYLSAALQLHPDEAYYWLWSRNLDAGYFDHPPLVAYFIWLTTLMSTSELWVRLSATVVALALSGLIWQLSRQLFHSTPIAAASTILFNVLPVTVLGLTVITPDVPAMLFWSLGVCIFWHTLRSQKTWVWYVLGLTFGLALLSKYTAILMVPCFLIYLLLTEDRHWLKTPHPYLAVLLGLLCFLPVILWNGANDWVSFKFQLKNGLGGNDLALGKVAEFTAGQLLITGPVVWLIGMYAALLWLHRRDKETLFLLASSVPIIAFFAVSSLRRVANPNWPVFAYFSFSIVVSHYCLQGVSRYRRALWCVAAVSSLCVSMATTLHARFNLVSPDSYSDATAKADATNSFHGWRELAAELQKYPDHAWAVTPSHQLSAEIMYYTHTNVLAQTSRMARPSQFDLWQRPHASPTKAGLYVWTDADFIGTEGEYFASPLRSNTLHIYRNGKPVRTYHIVAPHDTLRLPFSAR
jgi:undecaprenyl-diphosphatase